MQVSEKILPLYTVYYYTDFLYRIVKFKRRQDGLVLHDPDSDPQERFSQSYSRSRSKVLQYALCNQWDYFVTITVDPKKFDRRDLDEIWASLYLFIKFYSARFCPLRYLLVPEFHQDGAWHFHGFLSGVLDSHLFPFIPGLHPQKLIDYGFVNFPALGQAIGYVSLSKIKNPVAAGFYVSKYITKEHANDSFYKHLYFHSHGLKTSAPVADFYTSQIDLDRCLTFESDFVSCGWARLNRPDFAFPYFLDGCEPRQFEHLTPVDEAALAVEDPNQSFVQLSLDDWILSGSGVDGNIWSSSD